MRELQPELFEAIDQACREHELFHTMVEMKNWRVLMANVASSFLDIKEETGKNDGYLIELIQKTVDDKAQGEPYCLAFVMTVLAYVERVTGLTSPIIATESVMQLWNSLNVQDKTRDYPRPGYIAIWNHAGSSRGHAGIVYEVFPTYFTCIEGNSRSGELQFSGNVEGQGIFLKKRTYASVGSMNFLGFCVPFGY